MFPKPDKFEQMGSKVRHTFEPSPQTVTVERELRKICAAWQAKWDDLAQDHVVESPSKIQQQEKSIQTLGQLFDHLSEKRKAKVAIITHDRDRYKLAQWREELGNERLLTDIQPELVDDALLRIAKRTSPSTANSCLGVLKTYLTWAANTGLIKDQSHRTVSRLKEPAGQRHRRDWWTMDQVGLALRCAAKDSHPVTAILLVACGCLLGLRPEEIIMQRWEDLDLDAKDPKTGEPRPVCHVTPHSGWQPKDGEARDIPIATPLLAILREHRKAKGYLLMNEPHRKGRPRGGTGWIYRYNPRKVWLRVMKLIEEEGGKAITMYGMRHSFASNMLIANVSDVKVGRWMGHADTRMVHRHYGHLLSYDTDINAMKVTAPAKGED